MTVQLLGPFEQLLLSAVESLGKNAYGVTIHEKVSEMLGKETNSGSVYVTLLRMQDKGLVSSRLGDPTPERGGKPKRFYTVLPAGHAALREAIELSQKAAENVANSWSWGKWKPASRKR